MTSDAIFEKVKNLIAVTADLDASSIQLSTSFREIGMDSLDAVSLMSEVEEAFAVEIPNTEIFRITTVQGVLDAIERHRSKN